MCHILSVMSFNINCNTIITLILQVKKGGLDRSDNLPGFTYLANGRPKLNPGYASPESTLLANWLSWFWNCCLPPKSHTYGHHLGKAEIERKEKEIRVQRQRLWKPFFAPPVSYSSSCSWRTCRIMHQTSMHLTLHLVCPLSVTSHRNLCDRDYCLIWWMRLGSPLWGLFPWVPYGWPSRKECFLCATATCGRHPSPL